MHNANCVTIVLLLRLDSIGNGKEGNGREGKGKGLGRLRKWESVGSFDVRASGVGWESVWNCGRKEGVSVRCESDDVISRCFLCQARAKQLSSSITPYILQRPLFPAALSLSLSAASGQRSRSSSHPYSFLSSYHLDAHFDSLLVTYARHMTLDISMIL